MVYPEEFKKKCKEVYPCHEELSKYLERGDRIVGQILEEGVPNGVHFDIILNATFLEELKEIAKKYKEKQDLYEEWKKLDNAYRYQIYHS